MLNYYYYSGCKNKVISEKTQKVLCKNDLTLARFKKTP